MGAWEAVRAVSGCIMQQERSTVLCFWFAAASDSFGFPFFHMGGFFFPPPSKLTGSACSSGPCSSCAGAGAAAATPIAEASATDDMMSAWCVFRLHTGT